MYSWIYHKDTSCVASLNKQKYHFLNKIGEQEIRTGPVGGLVSVGWRRMWKNNKRG
jgi:hypothetical protein